MLRYHTAGFAGSGVAYSPFLDNRLAVTASANFGLVGNGRLYILDIAPNGTINEVRHFDTQDSLCSLAWSELHENHIVTASGDGTIRLFDVATAQPFPLQAFKEHAQEAFSVDWNLVEKTVFCSASWDGTVKIWDPKRPQSLATLSLGAEPEKRCVYSAKYSPHENTSILSAHADSTARLWDARTGQPSLTIRAVLGGDCLTVDWNKYRPGVIATGGVDKSVKVWDLRNLSAPTNEFRGHQFAVKTVKWSPHSPSYLVSTSYDMAAKVWSDTPTPHVPATGLHGLHRDFTHHTEFVVGADWSMWGEPGWLATVGYDQMLYIWKGF